MQRSLTFFAAALLGLGTLALWWIGNREGDASPVLSGGGGQELEEARQRWLDAPGAAPESVAGAVRRDTEVIPSASPSSEAAQLASSTLELAVVWQVDRAPAAAITVELVHVDLSGGSNAPFVAESDEAGRIRWERLHAGTYYARSRIGGWLDLELAAGAVQSATLELPAGFWIDGRVVDEQALPIADAEIWLGPEGHAVLGAVVARTLKDGSFALRTANGSVCIGARKASYRPSVLLDLESQPDARLPVTLVLHAGGGALAGRVTAEGAPRAGAWIIVGSGSHESEGEGPDGRYRYKPCAFETRSDEEGRFRLDGLPLGAQELRVRAPGCAAWLGTVELAENGVAELEVELAAEAILEGRITNGSGEPLAGALVQSGDEPHRILHRARRFIARSDVEGRFRVGELPAGERRFAVDAEGFTTVEATFALEAGSTTRWEPVLGSGERLFGRIVDANDLPLRDWQLYLARASESGPHVSLSVQSDAEGRFHFEGLAAKPHRLEAFDPEAMPNLASCVLTAAEPSPSELVLRIPDAARATAYLSGRLLDAAGRPAEGAEVRFGKESEGFAYRWPIERTGEFSIGPLPPDVYRLSAEGPGLPHLDLGQATLAPHQKRDLGAHRFAAGARVEVEIDAAPELDAQAKLFELWRDGAWVTEFTGDGRRGARDGLSAGIYELRLGTPGLFCLPMSVELRAGETKQVRIRVERGASVALKLETPEALSLAPPADLRVVSAAGGIVARWPLAHLRAGGFAIRTSLPAGGYRVMLSGDSVEAWSGELIVGAALEEVSCVVPLVARAAR